MPATTVEAADLATRLPDLGDWTAGYRIRASSLAAHLVQITCPTGKTFHDHLQAIGGEDAVVHMARTLDAWMVHSMERHQFHTTGEDGPDIPLLRGCQFACGTFRETFGPALLRLSADVPGIHDYRVLTQPSTWRTRLAQLLETRLRGTGVPPLAAEAFDATIDSPINHPLTIRGGHALLADVWTIDGLSPAHASDRVLDHAAAGVAAVLRHLHDPTQERRLRESIDAGERTMRLKLLDAHQDDRTAVADTRIVRPQFGYTKGDLPLISHYNVEANVTMIGDDLVMTTERTGGNLLVGQYQFHDERRLMHRMRRRGQGARTGLTMDPMLKICMDRDGVSLDQILAGIRSDPPTKPRAIGFGRDVKRIRMMGGRITVEIALSPDVTIEDGTLSLKRRKLPDSILSGLTDAPLSDLVVHPLLPPLRITRVANLRTGSVAVNTMPEPDEQAGTTHAI